MFEYYGTEIPRLERDKSKPDEPGEVRVYGTGLSDQDASAFIESFLIHTRNLFHFFARKRRARGKHPSDVYAADFVDSWDADKWKERCFYIYKHSKRLNVALAHLSTRRVKYAKLIRGWDIEAIYAELSPLIEDFKIQLPDDRKSWFERLE